MKTALMMMPMAMAAQVATMKMLHRAQAPAQGQAIRHQLTLMQMMAAHRCWMRWASTARLQATQAWQPSSPAPAEG